MKSLQFSVYLLLFFAFFSCQQKKKQEEQVTPKSNFSLAKQHPKVEHLNRQTQVAFDDWKEYDAVKGFIENFSSISPNDALNSAKELSDLVKSLQDSVQPKILVTPAFKARVNLLRNESLRLYDMSSITSIKANEVNDQVEKLLAAFSSMNAKMNTVIKQKSLDEDIEKDSLIRKQLPKKSPGKKELSKSKI